MMNKIKYEFAGKMWKHDSPAAWYFVSLPIELASEIRDNLKWQEEGWGRMKALAKIGEFEWKTAIWFDTKMKTYLLPIKAEARKKASLELEKEIQIAVWI